MAVQTPTTFLTSIRDQRRAQAQTREHATYRLSPNHLQDLRDVARGVEETNAGIACKYLIDQEGSLPADDVDEDGYIHHLHDLERWCDRFAVFSSVVTWRARIRRCRRALGEMSRRGDFRLVATLHVVYGPPDPAVRDWAKKDQDYFGELAALVRYTDIVEARRVEMARQRAVALSRQPGLTTAATGDVPDHWGAGAVEALGGDDERRKAINHGMPASHGAALVDFMRHREVYDYELRATSSGDALRAALAAFPDRRGAEAKEAYEQRKEGWELRRAAFATAARLEADRLLARAGETYHRAWLGAAT